MNVREGPPPPLPAVAQAILREFRDAEDMPPDARARVRRALKTGASRRGAEPRRSSGMLWVLVAVAAAIVVFYAVDRLLPQPAVQQRDEPLDVAPDQHVPSTVEGHAEEKALAPKPHAPVPPTVPPPAEAAPTAPEPAPTPEAAPSVEPAPPRSLPTRPRAKAAPVDPPAPTPPPVQAGAKSTLEAERRLIASAWAALTADAPGRALAVAREHADLFENGILAPERRAIEAIAHCQRDGNTGAATRFLRQYPRSPLAGRVRTACFER